MTDEPPALPAPKGFVTGIPRLLLYTAGYATGAAAREDGQDWTEAGLSLAAIALSASAIEAWIGEWFAIARQRRELPDQLQDLEMLPRGRPHEIVKQLVKAKRGAAVGEMQWYRRMRCLFELRNHLLHYHPMVREVGDFPDALAECVRQGAFRPGGDDGMDWTSRLLLRSVASQAAGIAHESIDALWELLVETPDGDAA